MPNKYYNRSKRKEQELVREAKKEGKIGIRSAGSKSPIDVVIIDKENHMIKLIQVKTGNLTDAQRSKLYADYTDLSGLFTTRFEVWHYP